MEKRTSPSCESARGRGRSQVERMQQELAELEANCTVRSSCEATMASSRHYRAVAP